MSQKVNPAEKDTTQWRAPLQDGIEDSRVYRQSVASVSRSEHDDRAVRLSMFNEAVDMFKNPESGPVTGRVEKLPGWLRLLQLVTTIAAILGAALVFSGWRSSFLWIGVAIFVVFLGLRLALAYVQHRITQDAWIQRMNQK